MNKQAFINAKPAVQAIEVPEWNDTVYIKKFSAGDRITFLKSIANDDDEKGAEKNLVNMVKLLQVSLSDEAGNRLFDDSQEDYDIIAAKDNTILGRLLDASLNFNGMGEEQEKAAIKN
jgi:hypothetical protein